MAIRHALTKFKGLRPYIEHGFLGMHASPVERVMRLIALDLKNYLFMVSARFSNASRITRPNGSTIYGRDTTRHQRDTTRHQKVGKLTLARETRVLQSPVPLSVIFPSR